MFKIDKKSGLPLYKQIENYIRSEIESGKYDDGSFLPKEEDIANSIGVSRNTVRQGISNLVNEGLLKRTQGKGTVLANKSIRTKLSEWHSFSNEMSKKGITIKDYYINAQMEYAPEEVYNSLAVNKEKKVVKVERLKGDINSPFVYFVSWFHPRVGLSEKEDYSQSLYSILVDKKSIIPIYSEEELDAILPNTKISELLEISEKQPILFRKRLVLDSGERPIEYNLGYYRSDKFKYSISFEREI